MGIRSIEFRGKRVDNGEWLYGYYCETENQAIHKYLIVPDYASICYGIDIILDTVGQYTGLKDIKGNKIFEGDVVKDKFEKIGVVEFNTEDVASCGCCYEYFTGTGFRAENICLHSCEIIGNIHDNPELLKGE